MHGRFTAQAPDDGEWCERGLLARIHRYTVKRLRAEIEPVEPRDLLRFLLEWQRAAPRARMEGPTLSRPCSLSSRASRRRRRLGDGDPAGAHQRVRPGVAR